MSYIYLNQTLWYSTIAAANELGVVAHRPSGCAQLNMAYSAMTLHGGFLYHYKFQLPDLNQEAQKPIYDYI